MSRHSSPVKVNGVITSPREVCARGSDLVFCLQLFLAASGDPADCAAVKAKMLLKLGKFVSVHACRRVAPGRPSPSMKMPCLALPCEVTW